MESLSAITDTGFVVALTNRNDKHHQASIQVYREQSKILLPQTVLAEVAYLLTRDAGIAIVIQFLQSLKFSKFELMGLNNVALSRTAAILQQYQDSRIDFVDASVMALAEHHKLSTVLTLDRRDFSLYRPQHCNSFALLP
ncbi:type II toxin-antitoxin system VapC family toxin [Prochlorothrix hollandica]|uniref:PilT protein domain-containing protein n=1 Tax=Prochlorothrix hollandica PCC 9006 = CALU 1027 TaxID=317619 RepID=A0A0M2Q0D7_PROHO|nr:PIN domain-containing protein [Prochlorothrix hollandica]KKJ00107.1 PilT protein domain-containing protein [Prochlorothrix hollandica PCC 9006 = CALU 1027]